jgi:anti-anti-sigma factor
MIETVRTKSEVLLKVSGNLDWMGAVSLRHVVHDSLEPGCNLTIDLGHVDAIDGVGVSAILGAVRRARASGGAAQIRNIPAILRRSMDLAGVSQILTSASALNGDDAA